MDLENIIKREHYKNSLKNLQIYRIFQNKYNL